MEQHRTQTRRRRFRGRIPAILPAEVNSRHDGWTVPKQGHFIGFLAETGSVSEAAKRVGMSRNAAYRLRARPGAEGFAAAWDVAVGMPRRKVTGEDLVRLAYEGRIRPVMYAGRYRGLQKKPCASALLRLVDRLDRAAARSTGVY
jgi:hypothetical protein